MIGIRDDTAPSPPSKASALAASIFKEGGWLQDTLSLEHRPQQESMARATASAFIDDEPLLFEAGTGVGKSLAYLVPGIIHAVDKARQLIVSTHTISLQEQIQAKDLPLCRRLFASRPELQAYSQFESAILVGKSNYLCTSRLALALSDRTTLFADQEYDELKRIAAWSETTQTGLRHELKPTPIAEVWDAVSADSAACSRKHCDHKSCFYQRARARIRSAQVIIVNHALLFALINAGGARAYTEGSEARGVLFPEDFVVLDEAHTVPEVAEANFGLTLSSYSVDRTLKHLYNPRTRRGVLVRFKASEAQKLAALAIEECARFFAELGATLLDKRPIVRVREPHPAAVSLDGPLSALERAMAKIADHMEDGRDRDEVLEQKLRVKAIQAGVTEWLTLGDKGHVYWAERGGRKQTIVTLKSAPIDVAPELRTRLFGCGVSVVCTSATLAVGTDMGVAAARMGATDARLKIEHSPFDFERSMRVYVAADVPLPSATDARLSLAALTDYIRFATERVSGGTLVLFTSYQDMRAVAASLEPHFADLGRPFLLQGEAHSRTEITEQMRTLGNAVLFGTDSFWTGVDIPGDALSQVIITRLPFSPPTHPIAEAKAEVCRERGGNPFSELTLPEALIKFRQGVGRLIRSQDDRGLITILDSRILAKTYGTLFIESLPQTSFERLTVANREGVFRPFA